MRKLVMLLAGAALVAAIGFAVAAMPRSTSLIRQFPELADLSDTKIVVDRHSMVRPFDAVADERGLSAASCTTINLPAKGNSRSPMRRR